MAQNRKFKRKVQTLTPGIHARRINTQINEKNNALKCDEDVICRTEIHSIIISSIREGIKKEDIINRLSENPRYEKYNEYLDGWIEDKMKKVNKEKSQREK